MRGPVGSLAVPDTPENYESLDVGAEGIVLYVHRDLAAGRTDVDFEFGLLGRCRAKLG